MVGTRMQNGDYNLVVFEDYGFSRLLPLVYWRAVFELRCGCQSLLERICGVQDQDRLGLLVREVLAEVTRERQIGEVYPQLGNKGRTLFVNGRCLLFDTIKIEGGNKAGYSGEELAYVWADADLAGKLTAEVFLDEAKLKRALAGVQSEKTQIKLIRYPWDLVHNNIKALESDWGHRSKDGIAGRICEGVHLLARENISVGSGSVVKPGTVLDAEAGPIMIGSNVTIRPNCTLEGPLYIGDNSIIQPGAVINEGVSIGKVCKVGGELESSIIHGYSNKQHDGFLGHSYIGEWVNLAADTVNSDLKNTYGAVRVPINGQEVDSGEMFVGLTMGDHSKTSVNTMFSTGSVVGFACSVFSDKFAPRFLPSFSWLTDEGRAEAIPEKTVAVAETVMGRRNVELTAAMRELFVAIASLAKEYEIGHEQAAEVTNGS